MASSSFSWKAKFLLISLNLLLCIIDLTQRPCEFCLFSLSSSMVSSSFSWIYDVFACFIGEIIRKLFRSHLVKELDRKSVHTFKEDEIERTSSMASSSPGSWRYDVFPSFSGQDVRKSFLSHLLKELHRKSIETFIDNRIERSLPIAPALLLAIKESKISIVIFSKNYASSTWCLNELVAIHKCFKELKQMVIPIFYDVAPSDVGKQTGEFGKFFEETCKGKPEDHKQSWMQALIDVAKIAGYVLLNGPDEANMIETITNYVSNQLVTPSSDVGDLVGLEAHLERLSSMLCLESEEARMVGIVGHSGIGKSTIGRALSSQHSSKFHHHAIFTYERTTTVANDSMKLSWEQQFLSKILGQKDIEIDELGEVEKRLKHRRVLIVLDDVDELELLKTLVGKTEWFGAGSRIIVITQNRQLLKAHAIDHVYEVEFPSEGLALEMLCRYAFGKNSPPDGFRELAVEVAKLAGNLPLGLSVLGSSLKGRGKDEWVEMMPRLRNDLDGKIEKTLRVSYDRLDKTDKELFLSIACFFKCKKVSVIEDLSGKIGLRTLADKFLIRKTPEETVEMHDLLQKLGIEIDREESERQPSRRRFLTNAEDIRDVLTDKDGIKSVLGISLDVTESFSIDENSFKSMPNLLYIIIHHSFWVTNYKDIIKLDLPQSLSCLPRKLKLLKWDNYPAKCLPSNFNAKYLVILRMEYSKLEKLWERIQPLVSLKKMNMKYSEYLKEIPDLSNAINLEVLNLQGCKSLVTLPSSFQSLESGLVMLNMSYCTNLTEFPDLSNAINLEVLNLIGCRSLVILLSSFQSLESLVTLNLSFCTKLTEIPDLSNAINLEVLNLQGCESLVTLPFSFQSLESLVTLNLSYCTNLTEIPDLSNAINLEVLNLEDCKSLVTLPSWIWNVPTHLNLESLKYYNLKGCCQLFNCPRISMIMTNSFVQRIEIEVEDCLWDKNLRVPSYLDCLKKCIPIKLRPQHFVELTMDRIMHKKLWEGVQSLESLVKLNLSFCRNLTEFPDLSKATNLEYLYIEFCNSLVRVPSTIGNLQKLKKFHMSFCDGLEVLPVDVNLASLSRLYLSACSRLRTFPQISISIKSLVLDYTAIEEVPCCIGNFSRLTSLTMTRCKSLKNICPNIFRLTRLQVADFSDCAMATMDFSCIPLHGNIEKRYHVEKRSMDIFNFSNCSNLDGELILRSCFKFMVLPGGEVPTYFKHRASGNNLTIILPQSSLSQEFLRFQACFVVGEDEDEDEVTDHDQQLYHISYPDHLVSCSFKFRPTVLPSKLDLNVVKFKFSSSKLIKGCGVQLLTVSPSLDVSNGSSDTEYNQQLVETGRSKRRMRMTSGISEEYFNLPFGQIVADTELTALDLELSLGQGEVSSVSSYPCVEGEALITELQDAEIPIVD